MIELAGRQLERSKQWIIASDRIHRRVMILTAVTLWLILGLLITMLLWAYLFSVLGIFETLEQRLYFSMVALTTLGFGDVLLPDQFRLLAGLIATDGFILFGLNTAFLFEVMRRIADKRNGS